MATRTYGGVSAERRREQRRSDLLDAALEIIGTRGFPALTVAGLCAQAGLNERYYYESFRDRDDVLATLVDRITGELVTAMGAAATAVSSRDPQDLRGIAHAAIRAAVELVTDDPRKARVWYIEAPVNAEVARRRAETIRPFITLMLDQTPAAGDSEQAAFIGTFLFGGVAETVTAWLREEQPVGRDVIVDRLTDLFVHVACTHLDGLM